MTCRSCIHWKDGNCRRRAPTIITAILEIGLRTTSVGEAVEFATRWPQTAQGDSCGEYEAQAPC